jgi:hypothetical protein
MYLKTIALLAAGVVTGGAALAQLTPDSAKELLGTWVWEIQGRNLAVLRLESGPQDLIGSLQRPAQINMRQAGTGVAVSGITLPVQTSSVQAVRDTADGKVLRTTDANGNTQEFVIRPDGQGRLWLRVDPDPRAPTGTLIRPRDTTSVATDWDPLETYLSRGDPEKSNVEMAEIYAADQADRKGGLNTDWMVVTPRDKARRLRVKQMLDEGLLRSGQDFHGAAFVFQHGDAPNDILLAHVLAMAAQARGHPDAGWIAMATLDRYLQNVGQAQVLGTQNVTGAGGGTTKGLYDENLVPDSLRKALGVPTRAEEAAHRAALEAARK